MSQAVSLRPLGEAARTLGFPSANALRIFLCRRPGLVEPRYRRSRRSTERLLSGEEIDHIRDLTMFDQVPAPPPRKRRPPGV